MVKSMWQIVMESLIRQKNDVIAKDFPSKFAADRRIHELEFRVPPKKDTSVILRSERVKA